MISWVYRCVDCGQEYARDEVTYLCPLCSKKWHPGEPLLGVLEVIFDYEEIRHQFDFNSPNWHLFSAIDSKFFPHYPVGNTPFFQTTRLSEEANFSQIWIKNDGLNPSGSLKDRASFLMVAEANRINEQCLVAASTGNAASALAAVCAAANKKAIIFVPEKAPIAKLVQMLQYGAKVIPVQGTYDDAFRLSLEYTSKKGGLNRNTAYHPLTIEGKKTVGLEIFAQNNFKVPHAILVSVGDGVIISGVYKAFYDLKEAGLIDHLPRLIAIQAETSDAIDHYVKTGNYENAKNPTTIADSISVSAPSNARMAKKAIIESQGFSLTVSDGEILRGQSLLASRTGIFAEPAAAAVMAGLQKISEQRLLNLEEQVVLLVTGNGLKDIEAARKNITIPKAIAPTLEAAMRA